MIDYSVKPSPEEVAVDLLSISRSDRVYECVKALGVAGEQYGFIFAEVSSMSQPRPNGLTLRHLICIADSAYDAELVRRVGQSLAMYDSASIAFSYQDTQSMLAFTDQIEWDKQAYGGRINFLRPDEFQAGQCFVSLQKIVDNAVCDTIRVKYTPRCAGRMPPLTSFEKNFFSRASSLYERHHMFLRAPSDGYFALRRGDGFLITATKSLKTPLDLSRISYVRGFDESTNELEYEGSFLPSSDAVEASIVFRDNPDITCIVHTHASDLFTRNPRYASRVLVPALPYGEPLLGHYIADCVRMGHDFVIMAEHGEIFTARGNFSGVFTLIQKQCEESLAGRVAIVNG